MSGVVASEELPVNPWEKWGWAFAAIWLVFLVFPIVAVTESSVPVAGKVGAFLCIAGFAVSNVLGYSHRRSTWVCLAVCVVLALATVPVIGIDVISFTPYLAILSALELPSPAWKWAVGVWFVVPLLSLLDIDGFPTYFFLMLWPIILGAVMLRIFGEREHLAITARGEHALVAERERVARDVHDVLGHSLTVVAVKAELAERLVDLDPERAKAELAEIQTLSRQALAEIRATVGGLRAARLGDEIVSARGALAGAGIAAHLPDEASAVDVVDPRHRTVLAWVLREAVTNVVRHSDADECWVELEGNRLVVRDDGRGLGERPEGNGVRGIRERVEAAGGRLSLTTGDEGHGTVLEVVL